MAASIVFSTLDHEKYMRRAIEVARKVPRRPFASLLVDRSTGEIFAEGLNRTAEHLDDAVTVADSVLAKSGVTRPDGVIVEKLGTQGDASLFKGVFTRYVGQFRDVLNDAKLHPELAQRIDRHLRASAASLLDHSVGADGLFTSEWQEGANDHTANFNTQTSALGALIALLPTRRP